ncbi:MAG: hypothetical protein HYY18_00850 [Planctomycetes bacterium]|nr:hypothetical protein [Planctomycetota bacterium]
MIPALLLIGIGWQRRLPVPIPLFLLWPVAFLAVLATGAVQLTRRLNRPAAETPLLPAPLEALFQLSGLRLDVRTHDGTGVLVWFL